MNEARRKERLPLRTGGPRRRTAGLFVERLEERTLLAAMPAALPPNEFGPPPDHMSTDYPEFITFPEVGVVNASSAGDGAQIASAAPTDEDSSRPAPFTAHLPPESIVGNMPGTIVPTADGFRAIGFVGDETVINEYDRAGQVIRTIHLTPPPGHTFGVSQFSDDGQWVKGQAFTATEAINVYWNLAHPDQPLTDDQLDPSARPSFSTPTASADGRVLAPGAESNTYGTVTVQVDGVIHEIRDPSGTPITGRVDHLFAGIGGVATRWIAVGEYNRTGYSGDYSDYFIAFSDGSMMRLWDFIHDQWPTDNVVFPHGAEVAIGSGSILFIEKTFSGPNCFSNFFCGNVMIDTGYQVTSIPLPDKWVSSPLDLNGDDQLSPADALAVINYLNDQGSRASASPVGIHSRYDIDDDGFVAPLDVLIIVNHLNSSPPAPLSALAGSGGEGEAPTASPTDFSVAAADAYFSLLQPRRRR